MLMNATAEASVVSTGAEDVKQALQLLNSMGTCSDPPQKRANMDFHLMSSVLYAFYIGSTIGYGDLNVRTLEGMAFVVGWSCVAMWVFGWFAVSITSYLTLGISTSTVCVHGAMQSWRGRCIRMYKETMGAKRAKQRVKNSEDGISQSKAKSTGAEAEKQQAKALVRVQVALTFAFTFLYIVLFAAFCVALESGDDGQDWTFFESVWFTFISCTTIGFGDMYPNRNIARIVVTMLQLAGLAVGLALFAMATGDLVSLFESSVDEVAKDTVGLARGAEALALAKARRGHAKTDELDESRALGIPSAMSTGEEMSQYREEVF
jgi:hypothetical protein